jgi:membrane peptidoglycan carboxypeptidase
MGAVEARWARRAANLRRLARPGRGAGSRGRLRERPPLKLLGAFALASALAGALMTAYLLPMAGSAAWAINSGVDYFESLPAELSRPPLPQRSVLLAANGAPVTYFFDENRVEVPLSSIAPVLRHAVIAIEDARFYQHGGVDPRGVARAAVNDVAGGEVQGASTLSQQYVKNVLVEQAVMAGDRAAAQAAVVKTPARKIREMRLAVALENRLGKDQILESYLNIAYFGGHTYGVEAAAQRYFGVPASRVTVPQAAMLAGLIAEPGTYDPTRHPRAARVRRDVVLDRMVEQGFITPTVHDQAVATPVVAAGRPPRHGCIEAHVHGYFCDFVLRTLLVDPGYAALGATEAERLNTVNRGGLVIRTTLDVATGEAATRAVERAVPPRDASGLGAVAVTVEPGTGRVVSMVQNRRYAVTSGPGLTSVNYATDRAVGGATGFQTGSSFKPFTLAAWLEAGHELDDRVDATKRAFPFRSFTACGRHLRGTKPYTPGNAEGHETGSMTVLQATYDSVNVAYVDMESRLDLCAVRDVAGRLGVHLAVPSTECGAAGPTTRLPSCLPSLTLGVKEIAPLTMAAAYAGFAAGGVYCRPYAVASLERASGAPGEHLPVKIPGPSCSRAIDRDVAHGVTTALTQVIDKGTAAGLKPLPWPAAGKTGTTDGPYDSWFVGYTARRSTAVWVADPGRAEPSGEVSRRRLTDLTVAGRRYGIVYGATIAAPLWKDVMISAMKALPAR